MIRRALAAGVPFSWLAADTVYGVGEVEQVLRQAGKGYVLGVAGTAEATGAPAGTMVATGVL